MSTERYQDRLIAAGRRLIRAAYWKFGDWYNDPKLRDEMRKLWMEGFETARTGPSKSKTRETFS